MKVLLVGYHNPNFVNSTVYRDKAVEYLGHQLISFDDRSFFLPGRLRDAWSALQEWDLQRLNQNTIKCVRQEHPDLCIVVGGQRMLPQSVLAVKNMGVPTALWTTDAPFDFKNVLESAPFYDRLYCAGTEAMDIFHEKGLKHACWLPFGCDPHFHKPMDVTEENKKKYGKDIVFVGSFYPNRVGPLEAIADFDLGVWGPYWNRIDPGSPLKPKVHEIKMNYEKWVNIYNAAKIVLVTHYKNEKVPCHQASPKLFEAMACGAFILCDKQKDAMSLFEDKKHLVFFNDDKDLREKVKYYLAREEERRTIARQGMEEAVRQHTYRQRMERIINGKN